MSYIRQGTTAFRKTNLALFAGGFTTFAVLYSTQPLLPVFTDQFHISPASASLSLSVATISLAVSMLVVGSLSEAWGRRPVMLFSLFAVSATTLLAAAALAAFCGAAAQSGRPAALACRPAEGCPAAVLVRCRLPADGQLRHAV